MNALKNSILFCLLCLLSVNAWAQQVVMNTPNTSFVVSAPIGGDLKFVYYGSRLSASDLATLATTEPLLSFMTQKNFLASS